MFLLWPGGIGHDHVILFLTETAPHIVKAGKSITLFYPKIIHLSCLADALNRMGEGLKGVFTKTDKNIFKALP